MKFKLLSAFTIALLSLLIPLTVAVYSGPGDFDIDGRVLILDADADTSIQSTTDDSILITVGGTPIPSQITNTSTQPTRFSYFRRSTTNQTKTNDTLTNSEIQFVGLANSTYQVQFVLNMEAVNIGNIFGWGLPSSATADGLLCSGNDNCESLTEAAPSASISVDGVITITGIIVTSGTPGTITIQWAQAMTNATANTLYADSYGWITKIS